MKKFFSIILSSVIVASAALCFAGCNQEVTMDTVDTSFLGKDAAVKEDGEHQAGYQLEMPEKGDTIAILHTNMGDITWRFFPENAPKTVQNFIDLAKAGKYDNSIFHRVINNFMIQGGDYENANGTGGKAANGGQFEDEFCNKLFNIRGSVAMANSGKDTNGSQFFINQATAESFSGFTSYEESWKVARNIIAQYVNQNKQDDIAKINGLSFYNPTIVPDDVKKLYEENGGNPYLDGAFNAADKGHTVFAQVIDGMDVVDKIAKTEVDQSNMPKTPVVINTVEITTYQG
ncbi:MAG: peptidylprolyl isomerase [Acutalibacteraceae bacterium]